MTDPAGKLFNESASIGGSSSKPSQSGATAASGTGEGHPKTFGSTRPTLLQRVQRQYFQEPQDRIKHLQEHAIDLIGQREPMHEAFDSLSDSLEEWRQQDPHTDHSLFGLGQAAQAIDLACQLGRIEFHVPPRLPKEAPTSRSNDMANAMVRLDQSLSELMEGNSQSELTTTLIDKMAGRLLRLRTSWGIEIGQIKTTPKAPRNKTVTDHAAIDKGLKFAVGGMQRELSQNYWDRRNSLTALRVMAHALPLFEDACRQIKAASQNGHSDSVMDTQRFEGVRAFSVIATCHAYSFLRHHTSQRFAEFEPITESEFQLNSDASRVYRTHLLGIDSLVDTLADFIRPFDPFPGAHGVIEVLEALQRLDPKQRNVNVQPDERLVLQTKPPKIKGYEEFAQVYEVLRSPLPLQSVTGDLNQVEQTLIGESPWLKPITQQIFRRLRAHFALDHDQRHALLPTLLLVGDPSSGKTHFAQRLTNLLGLSTTMVSLSGMSDSMTFRGAPRGYSSARSSIFVQKMIEQGIANPTFILDEIDKVGRGSLNGHPHDVLLQCLEQRNAQRFFDECLQVPLDLSYCTYIATANSLDAIPMPLRSRFQIIQVKNPSRTELRDFAIRYWARQMTKYGYSYMCMPGLPNSTLDVILTKFKTLRGVTRAIEDLVAIDISRQNRPDSMH